MTSVEARYRLLHAARGNRELQAQCIAACKNGKEGINFWFDYFAYTFDPRLIKPDLPFNLMADQRVLVNVAYDCIMEGEPLLIEKSRDRGVTWILGSIGQYFWQFVDGSDILIGSKKEKDVDAKGARGTIFEKIRYNIRMQPKWMLPRLNKTHDSKLKLVHPVNGNSITGQASTSDIGRSGRFKFIILDEFAFHPYGKAAYEACTHSTNCIFLPSTPNGKANEFYKLRSEEDLDWIDIESHIAALDK